MPEWPKVFANVAIWLKSIVIESAVTFLNQKNAINVSH